MNFDKQNYDGYNEFTTEKRGRRRPGRKRRRRPANNDEYWKGQAVEDDADVQPSENFNDRRRKTNFENTDTNRGRERKRTSFDRETAISPLEEPRIKQRIKDNTRYTIPQSRNIPKDANEQKEHLESSHKSHRRPYSQAKRLEEDTPTNDKASELKTILKQSGGLSLSEILQQKNLSLTDLLKGKQIALAALTDTPKTVYTSEPSAAPDRRQASVARLTTPSSRTTSISESNTADSDNDGPKRNLRIPNYGKMKTNPTASVTDGERSELNKPARRIPSYASTATRVNNENSNFIEENVENTTPFTLNQDANSTIATPETKETILNPIMPTVKEDKRRPIKGIVSKIRPDLSNSNTKTEEMYESSKRLSHRYNSNMNNSNRSTPTHREKWTPTSMTSRREKFQIKFNQTNQISKPTVELTNILETTSENSMHKTEAVTDTTLESFITTTMPVETTPLVTTTTIATTVRDIQEIRNKMALNLRNRQSSLPTVEKISLPVPEANENSESEEFENYPIFNVTPKQKRIDSTLNSIEKLSQFEDSKPHDISPLDNIFNEESTTHQEQDWNSERNSRAKKFNDDLIMANGNHNTQRSFTIFNDYTTIRDVTESNPSLFADLTSPKTVDDKIDIIELMRDRRNGARLAKVLSQRNMTLEELIEHRQRGSSNLHLSEIVNNKDKKSKEKLDNNFDIVTAFEHFPRFNIGNLKSVQPDDIKTDSQGFSYFTSIINIRPTDEAYKEARHLQDLQKEKKTSYSQWDSIKFAGDNNFLGNGGPKASIISSRVSPPTDDFEGNDSDTIKRAEAIEQEVQRANELLEFNSLGANEEYQKNLVTIETTQIPAGIRSAIIASSSIVGVSLFIFILIFIACRWRHNRKTKLNYTENFKIAKGRLPILQKEQLKTTQCQLSPGGVYSSTRCQSKLNTMDPNSPEVQDYLWDTMRKPFQ